MILLVTLAFVLLEASDECAQTHYEGGRCILHLNRNRCLSHYNEKADGDTMLDKICGWSLNGDKFGGKGKYNCLSTPLITRKKMNAEADFGKCNTELGGGGPEESELPCGTCEEFHGDKTGCLSADSERYCVDKCYYNDNIDKCFGATCSDMNGKSNMFKCAKYMKKKDLNCYFDVTDNNCKTAMPDLQCSAYNKMTGSKGKKKKACMKLGKEMHNCTFSSDTKSCQAKDGTPMCSELVNKVSCEKYDCNWNKDNETCRNISTVECSEMDGLENMFECSKAMAKKGATCYFDITDNTCKDSVPDVTCEAYNALDELKVKDACVKLGKEMHDCVFSNDTKMCKLKGEKSACADIKSKDACERNDCFYIKEFDTCVETNEVKCSDMNGYDNMFDCTKNMKKMGLDCYFDVTDDQCKDSIPDVPCSAYNNLPSGTSKEACLKLGKDMHNCSFNGDTKLCQVKGSEPSCTDYANQEACEKNGCVYSKDNESCHANVSDVAQCSDKNGIGNMYKCASRMKKLYGLDCYFDVTDNTCNDAIPDITCEAYNTLGSTTKIKKACVKLGEVMHACKFHEDTKLCQDKDATPNCSDILNGEACTRNGCQYLKSDGSCVESDYIAATCSEMNGNMFECTKQMQKKDLDCYYDITDNKCKDDVSEVECDAYNHLNPSETKEACIKLGEEMHNCTFNSETKLCQEKGATPPCDAFINKEACDKHGCEYNKDTESCGDVVAPVCSDMDGAENMYTCSDKMKKMGVDCYFNITNNKCEHSKPDVSCDAYNELENYKKACTDIGGVMHNCAYNTDTKLCQVKGENPVCADILNKEACDKNGCTYLKESGRCTEYIAPQCSDMDGVENMYTCSEKMKTEGLDCFFNITNNECEDSKPDVSCDAYNELEDAKKPCTDLGKEDNCAFNPDTKKCQVKGEKPVCADILNKEPCEKNDCTYLKENSTCTDFIAPQCSDMDGVENLYGCSDVMKKEGLDCFFDITANQCRDSIPEVSCEAYNSMGSLDDIKKGCTKLGEVMHNCEFSTDTKLCQLKGAKPTCTDIVSQGACTRNGCKYDKENETCIDE